jgi:hypothetical protein
MLLDCGLELTYCTNIHPANGWSEVFQNVSHYAPALRKRLSPAAPFGIGLRLSAAEAAVLVQTERLQEFHSFLQTEGLYVALLNGFPYGSFHGEAVKEQVFAPDWREEERVEYTLHLVEILENLLPPGKDGGISTLPLSYNRWISPDDGRAREVIVNNLVRVAEALVRSEREHNRTIHLDIEPEPDGLVENSHQFIEFYRDWLLPLGAPLLAGRLEVSIGEARDLLLRHICLCLDTCHFAVEYEDVEQALAAFDREGIRIGRVQISSALEVVLPETAEARNQLGAELADFADSIYLHQVIEENRDSKLHSYRDLPEALQRMPSSEARRWRIHFHVPLFVEKYATFGSTQNDLCKLLGILRAKPFTHHLEIETYTWSVLPSVLKLDLLESIDREYRWVMDQLCKRRQYLTSSD